jgi:hypothetical protein
MVVLVSQMLACGGGDGLSDYQRMKLTQDQAIAELQKIGGKVTSKTYQMGNGFAVDLTGASINDQTFEHLKALQRVAELNLSKTSITDAQLPELVKAGGMIFKLDLSNTAVTDSGIAALHELYLLLDLNVANTKVTPGGAEQFRAKRKADTKLMDMFKATRVRV